MCSQPSLRVPIDDTTIVTPGQEPEAWDAHLDTSFLDSGPAFMLKFKDPEIMQSTPVKNLTAKEHGRFQRRMRSMAQKEAFHIMRMCGTNPLRVKVKSRNEVVALCALKVAAQEAIVKDPESRNTIHRLCMSKYVEDSGAQSLLKERLGLVRSVTSRMKKRISGTSFKSGSIHKKEVKKRHSGVKSTKRKLVEKFYCQDFVSRQCPGKTDLIKNPQTGEERVKRILVDYVHNIHARFLAEHPGVHVHRSTFHRWKPWWVLLSKHLSKDTAMCQQHQNFGLRLKAFRKLLPDVTNIPKNPDTFVKNLTAEQVKALIDDIDTSTFDEDMEYHQWKKITDINDGKPRTRKVVLKCPVEEFLHDFYQEFLDFAMHCKRIFQQYGKLKKLKENLKPGEMIIQIDFSENWHSQISDAVQGSYFNQTPVTIHTGCAWFWKDGVVQKKSFAHLSPVNAHGCEMVHAILAKSITNHLAPLIEENNIRKIHYWSDSPSSQYRNRFMFKFIAEHERRFGIIANWSFFEAGHGKGPCDGVGAVLKRLADMAQRHGADIQDAWDFFKWAKNNGSVKIEVFFISPEDYEEWKEVVDVLRETTVAVPGTMKIHAIRDVPGHSDYIEHRQISCDCDDDDECACPWETACLVKKSLRDKIPPIGRRVAKVDDWVIIEYHESFYYGQVIQLNEVNGNCHVKCMERHGFNYQLSFRWPRHDDWCLCSREDILAYVDPPVESGRRQNTFKLNKKSTEIWRLLTET